MEKHQLFMLTPWKEGSQGPYYCPDCGVVEGFFAYTPEARELVEIIHVEYQRPRPGIVNALGAENQGSPVLVLATDTDLPPGGKKSMSTGRSFIDDPVGICNFLGRAVGGVLPHP